jgi:hypothetical protein
MRGEKTIKLKEIWKELWETHFLLQLCPGYSKVSWRKDVHHSAFGDKKKLNPEG